MSNDSPEADENSLMAAISAIKSLGFPSAGSNQRRMHGFSSLVYSQEWSHTYSYKKINQLKITISQ